MRSGPFVVILFLCACAPVASQSNVAGSNRRETAAPAEKPDQLADHDTCGRSRFRDLIGHSEGEIDRTSLPANTRIICYNCAATMDMTPDRLNILLDRRGNVSELRCG